MSNVMSNVMSSVMSSVMTSIMSSVMANVMASVMSNKRDFEITPSNKWGVSKTQCPLLWVDFMPMVHLR